MKLMYYVVYDVSRNKTRRKISRVLKDNGLYRIQKSAFCGPLSSQQKKDLVESLKRQVTEETDSVYVIAACNNCFGKIQILGKGFDIAYVTNRTPAMVI